MRLGVMFQELIVLILILISQPTSSGHSVVCVCNSAYRCTFASKRCTQLSNFSSAFSEAKLRNNTIIRLSPAKYNLHNDTKVGGNFWYRVNVSIIGEGSAGSVIIKCGDGAGLGFFNSTNITVKNVAFDSCAMWQNSTTPDHSKQKSSSFIKIGVALYFLKCQDIRLIHVVIENSHGFGLILYNTFGNSYLYYVTLNNNKLSNSSHNPGGGGAVFEYSYCNPEDPTINCSDSTFYNNSKISFHHCRFKKNNSTAGDDSFWKRYDNSHTMHQSHSGFGRGGGLSISLSGNVNNTRVDLYQCSFIGNQAKLGGGLFIKIDEVATAANITIRKSNFANNGKTAGQRVEWTHGGGVNIMLVTTGCNYNHTNAINFSHCVFNNNHAVTGGAIDLLITKSSYYMEALQGLTFYKCYFEDNDADIGSAMHFSTMEDLSNGFLPVPCIETCTFKHNYINNRTSQAIGMGSVYSDTIPVHVTGRTQFLSNNGSALAISATQVQFGANSSTLFLGNTGSQGGAVALLNNAWMEVMNFSRLNFTHNTARDRGGAIYFDSSGEENLIYRRFWKCFIRHQDSHKLPNDWNVTFYFNDNSVYNYGESYCNSIYAVSIESCIVMVGKENFTTAMQDVFCWKNWTLANKCTHDVMTSPAGLHWRMDTFETYPGKLSVLPLTVTDDKGMNITDYVVLNAYISNGPARLDSRFHLLTANSIVIYQNSTTDSPSRLVIETTGTRKLYSSIEVTVLPCPPGMILDSSAGKCVCSPAQFGGVVLCYDDNSTTVRKIQSTWCMSIWNEREQNITVVGPWMFSSQLDQTEVFVKLPDKQVLLDEEICGKMNRTGLLCSRCKDGYGVAVFSLLYQCVKCNNSHAWLIYSIVEFLPITLFFLIIVLLNININNGKTNALIFYCQMTALPINVDWMYHSIQALIGANTSITYMLWNIVILPYSLWNLDILRTVVPPFCLSQHMRMIDALALDYVTAVYPLLLVMLCYTLIELHGYNFRLIVWMWYPFAKCFGRFRRQWNLQTCVIEAFATFLVLSYTKFANVSVTLLLPSYVRNSSGKMVGPFVLFFDPSITYLGRVHIPFFVLALVVMVFVVILPPLFLIFYPMKWFRNLLERWRIRRQVVVTFVEAFQWCYKDGTNGTPDRRFISACYFFFRLVSVVLMVSIPDVQKLRFWQLLATQMAFLAFAVLHPYKKEVYNYTDCVFAFLLSAILAYSQFLSHGFSWTAKDHGLFMAMLLAPLFYMLFVPINEVYERMRSKISVCNKRTGLSIVHDEILERDHSTNCKSTEVTYTEVAPSELSGRYPDRILNPHRYAVDN